MVLFTPKSYIIPTLNITSIPPMKSAITKGANVVCGRNGGEQRTGDRYSFLEQMAFKQAPNDNETLNRQ